MKASDLGEERRAEVAFSHAFARMQNKEYDKAISLFVDVMTLAHDPYLTVRSLYMIGLCFFEQYKYEQAEAFLEISLEKFKEQEEEGAVQAVYKDLDMIRRKKALH